jgi:hypothetical protein
MTDIRIDAVLQTYLKLRERKEELDADHKQRVAAIKAKMEKFEAWIKQHFDETGQTQAKVNGIGTAFLTTVDYARVADWDAVLTYIKDHDAYELLERRVSKNAVREIINRDKNVPAGINYGSVVTVQVRKAGASADE